MGVFTRWSARGRYFAAADESWQAWDDFMDTSPAARRDALLSMADCERTMADNAFGFRRAARTDWDGFTTAQSHGMAALLLAMVADTEREPGTPWQPTRRSTLDDDPAVTDVLSTLAATTDLRTRAARTLVLYDVVAGRVGGQAAEVLAAGVAYGYYRLSGLPDAQARTLTGPNRPRWTR